LPISGFLLVGTAACGSGIVKVAIFLQYSGRYWSHYLCKRAGVA